MKYAQVVVMDTQGNVSPVLNERFYNVIEAMTASLGINNSFVTIYDTSEDGTSTAICDINNNGKLQQDKNKCKHIWERMNKHSHICKICEKFQWSNRHDLRIDGIDHI